MLKVECRSRLVSFCDRVSKVDDVYVVAKRGKNSARVQQVWRLDDPDKCFDVGELMAAVESRLITDPSDMPTFVSAHRYGTGEQVDHVRIEPVDEAAPEGGQDATSVLHLTHSLTRLAEGIQTSAALDRASLQSRYDRLHESYLEVVRENAELRAIQAADLQALEFEHGSGMTEAMQVLSPFVQVVLGKMLAGKTPDRKQIAGPTDAPEPAEVERPAINEDEIDTSGWGDDDAQAFMALLAAMARKRPELLEPYLGTVRELFGELGAELPADTAWTPARADQVVAQVEELATHHVELITDEHLERLLQPLQGRVAAFLMGG